MSPILVSKRNDPLPVAVTVTRQTALLILALAPTQ